MAKPLVYLDQMTLARRMAEERHPTDDKLVDFAYDLLEAHAPAAPGDLPKTLPCTFERLGSDPQFPAGQEAMAQELAFPYERHRALVPVHTQFEFLFEELRHARQHPLSRRLGLYIDVAVVGIATERVPAFFQFL